jgi:hypothetical protein
MTDLWLGRAPHRDLRMFYVKILRTMFGSKKYEVTGGCREFHNVETS